MNADRNVKRWVWAITISIAVLVVGFRIVYASYVYDDWTCAFAHCVKVKP